MRNRSLGDFYSIDSIKDRIKNKEKYAQKEKTVSTKTLPDSIKFDKPISYDANVKKLIDVNKNKKAQEHKAYRRKLNMTNISTYAGMINFIKKYHLVYADDFENAKNNLEQMYSQLTDSIKDTYRDLNALEADIKQYQKYLNNKSAHECYIRTSDKDEKFFLSEANKMYESAMYYFKKNNIDISQITPETVSKKMKKMDNLNQRLDQLKVERKYIKNDVKQLTIIADNNRSVLGDEFKSTSKHQEKKDIHDRNK